MTGAPERIWVDRCMADYRLDQWSQGTWVDCNGGGEAEEYLRADIAAEAEAQWRAEVKRLTQERDEARSRFNDIDLCRMASAPCENLLAAHAEADRLRAEADALVAAAYEDAAQTVDAASGKTCSLGYIIEPYKPTKVKIDLSPMVKEVRARTKADTRAALDRMLAEARKDGMREAAEMVLPTGANWGSMELADIRDDIIAAAEKEAGK